MKSRSKGKPKPFGSLNKTLHDVGDGGGPFIGEGLGFLVEGPGHGIAFRPPFVPRRSHGKGEAVIGICLLYYHEYLFWQMIDKLWLEGSRSGAGSIHICSARAKQDNLRGATECN